MCRELAEGWTPGIFLYKVYFLIPTLRFSKAGTRAARTGQICSSNQVMSTSSSNKKVGTHTLTHKVLTYIEYRAVSGVLLTLHPQRVCPPRPALAGQ
jgi:hypothetical protein